MDMMRCLGIVLITGVVTAGQGETAQAPPHGETACLRTYHPAHSLASEQLSKLRKAVKLAEQLESMVKESPQLLDAATIVQLQVKPFRLRNTVSTHQPNGWTL